MKSAYELAMERLEKASGPTKKLSDAQKARIADIEKTYEAKIAETKLAYDPRMLSAASIDELNQLKKELADAIIALEERREKEKEAVWNAE
jgi:hypothetical protein